MDKKRGNVSRKSLAFFYNICKYLHENLANEEKAVTAICHGFLVISLSQLEEENLMLIAKTNSLPSFQSTLIA